MKSPPIKGFRDFGAEDDKSPPIKGFRDFGAEDDNSARGPSAELEQVSWACAKQHG